MRNHWYIACYSKELKNKPLPVKILNEPIVLFRDESNNAVALFNRCPHRNASFSKGKVIKGNLQCPYHGWEFNKEGKCAKIPSLYQSDKIPPNAFTNKYPLIEQDGYIWLWLGDREPLETEKPLAIEHYSNYCSKSSVLVQNKVENCVDNFMDSPHTGYVHAGLFRNEPSHITSANIKIVEDGVKVHVKEASKGNALLAKLILGEDTGQEHEDYFIMPSTVRVSYSIGKIGKIRTYHLLTPVEDFVTRLYIHVVWNFGILNPLLKVIVTLSGKRLLRQDVNILNQQGIEIKKYGEHYVSSVADTANVWVKNYLQRIKENREMFSEREKAVKYKL